jgi:hypothetical protein
MCIFQSVLETLKKILTNRNIPHDKIGERGLIRFLSFISKTQHPTTFENLGDRYAQKSFSS